MCRLFHIATFFGFCITHILKTWCAKIKKKICRQKVNQAVYCEDVWGSGDISLRILNPLFAINLQLLFKSLSCKVGDNL